MGIPYCAAIPFHQDFAGNYLWHSSNKPKDIQYQKKRQIFAFYFLEGGYVQDMLAGYVYLPPYGNYMACGHVQYSANDYLAHHHATAVSHFCPVFYTLTRCNSPGSFFSINCYLPI